MQETIGGDKGFRAEHRVGVWTDGELMARECVDSAEIQKGWYWGVLCAEWNGDTHARYHKARERGIRSVWTTGGRVRKGTDTGRGIRLA